MSSAPVDPKYVQASEYSYGQFVPPGDPHVDPTEAEIEKRRLANRISRADLDKELGPAVTSWLVSKGLLGGTTQTISSHVRWNGGIDVVQTTWFMRDAVARGVGEVRNIAAALPRDGRRLR